MADKRPFYLVVKRFASIAAYSKREDLEAAFKPVAAAIRNNDW
jgi:hypothetical protein